ncbi:DNA topoisomerase 2 [Ceratobasidium sp. 395]|nr:DNA topoisomerase 2 [Ceratobasidium sp. 395]
MGKALYNQCVNSFLRNKFLLTVTPLPVVPSAASSIMFSSVLSSFAACDISSTPFFTKTEHLATVGCALAAILSDPNLPADAPPEFTGHQYRFVVERLNPSRQFEEVDAELNAKYRAFDEEFAEGVRKAAVGVEVHHRMFTALLEDWESNKEGHGPEPEVIRMAREGLDTANLLLKCASDGANLPAWDIMRAKLAILVVDKLHQAEMLEASMISDDATFNNDLLKQIENIKDDESDGDASWIVKNNKESDGEPEAAPAARKNKGASEMHEKLTQLQHILKHPDTYIGSIESITQKMWTFDAESKRMVYRDVTFVPGLFKIDDEILVNAADNKANDPSMDTIKVDIHVENGIISVYNNGKGIPVEIHSKEKIYIPEMIFGHLLTSSNYDDDEKKLTGGRNGYGAKLTNIYSTEFTIDTADKNTSQKYKRTWTDNMSKPGKAKITKNGKGEEYTKVSFKPDFKRFGMDGIDEDTAALLRRRVYDMAGTVKNVKVFLNGERIKIKNFKQYVELYVNCARGGGEEAGPKLTIIFEQISSRWEVAFTLSKGSFQHISFANSIATTKGGTHLNLIAGIEKKNKNAKVKPQAMKNHMWIPVNALIENSATLEVW